MMKQSSGKIFNYKQEEMHLELNYETLINIKQSYLNILARGLCWASKIYTALLMALTSHVSNLSLSTAMDQKI
jgi:hypothetical protein